MHQILCSGLICTGLSLRILEHRGERVRSVSNHSARGLNALMDDQWKPMEDRGRGNQEDFLEEVMPRLRLHD